MCNFGDERRSNVPASNGDRGLVPAVPFDRVAWVAQYLHHERADPMAERSAIHRAPWGAAPGKINAMPDSAKPLKGFTPH